MNKIVLAICATFALMSAGCSSSPAATTASISTPAAPSVDTVAFVNECAAAPIHRPNFKVAEASPDGLFIRVVTNGEPTHAKALEIIDVYANDYDRIDICAPESTERGEECMSFMDGVLIDYLTGKSIPIEI